jgi:hypothetical protein
MAQLLWSNTTSACRDERRATALRDVLEPLRNGVNRYFRYTGRLCVSDGARDAAGAAECYWIFDLLSSEVVPLLTAKANDGTFRTSILTVRVVDSRATLEVTDSDDAPPLWSKTIALTDFPQGQWTLFELGPLEFDADGCRSIVAILLSEH